DPRRGAAEPRRRADALTAPRPRRPPAGRSAGQPRDERAQRRRGLAPHDRRPLPQLGPAPPAVLAEAAQPLGGRHGHRQQHAGGLPQVPPVAGHRPLPPLGREPGNARRDVRRAVDVLPVAEEALGDPDEPAEQDELHEQRPVGAVPGPEQPGLLERRAADQPDDRLVHPVVLEEGPQPLVGRSPPAVMGRRQRPSGSPPSPITSMSAAASTAPGSASSASTQRSRKVGASTSSQAAHLKYSPRARESTRWK